MRYKVLSRYKVLYSKQFQKSASRANRWLSRHQTSCLIGTTVFSYAAMLYPEYARHLPESTGLVFGAVLAGIQFSIVLLYLVCTIAVIQDW